MVLRYKLPGSQNLQQLHMDIVDDKRDASAWLGAMHKVGVTEGTVKKKSIFIFHQSEMPLI